MGRKLTKICLKWDNVDSGPIDPLVPLPRTKEGENVGQIGEKNPQLYSFNCGKPLSTNIFPWLQWERLRQWVGREGTFRKGNFRIQLDIGHLSRHPFHYWSSPPSGPTSFSSIHTSGSRAVVVHARNSRERAESGVLGLDIHIGKFKHWIACTVPPHTYWGGWLGVGVGGCVKGISYSKVKWK